MSTLALFALLFGLATTSFGMMVVCAAIAINDKKSGKLPAMREHRAYAIVFGITFLLLAYTINQEMCRTTKETKTPSMQHTESRMCVGQNKSIGSLGLHT